MAEGTVMATATTTAAATATATPVTVRLPACRASEVDAFLARFPPSRTPASEAAWIAVDGPPRDLERLPIAADEQGLLAAWTQLREREALTAMQLSQQHVERLARTFGVLTGKWMVFCGRERVDQVWTAIARATAAGGLGDAIGAKVSPATPLTGDAYRDQHVICVYVEDFTDEGSVGCLRAALRQLGVPGKLAFKPDAFTLCGIYANNPWGIPPCLYYE